MPKYWGKQIFAHGRFPEVGQKQKTEEKREREKERLNNGENNGQATHGVRKPPGPTTKGCFTDLNLTNQNTNKLKYCKNTFPLFPWYV